ncbi:Uncharacterized protein OS=Planctomyces maris DSM 8797 GN=PM8797T_24106 PE=4 SV=1 [Gemmata massiliana]|uniref:Uncharacterized protein n=1 Tax=Gemmata massiliana TaxID=1210884 RepID=A0A6P2D611_9BACT|nr:hypothetical protein [Gemmata massiliana]VTR95564.1 Uncharacterized protein OS=Planctomyces maris DSM 8797 GN=PM8797T_24106 PE=4 SV=1 [Gemmata massiliana]
MAKSKETNVPLISALVFFVLTTIAFGVMWYLSFSEMETHVNAKKTAEKDLAGVRSSKDEAERLARVYRIYLGIAKDDDVTVIESESKAGDKIASELKQINDAMAAKMVTSVDKEQKESKDFVEKRLATMNDAALREYVTGQKLNESIAKFLTFWQVDNSGKANKPPSTGLLDQIAGFKNRGEAYSAAEKERDSLRAQITLLAAEIKAYKALEGQFKTEIDQMPAKIADQSKQAKEAAEKAKTDYETASKAASASNSDLTNKLAAAERELTLNKKKIESDNDEIKRLNASAARKENEQSYDEPLGKIVRKVPNSENVFEANVGSSSGVRVGFRFQVLPYDFPEKGYKSRVLNFREYNEKERKFENVPRFKPKGAVEVIEVVNERLSRVRYEPDPDGKDDPIRDGIIGGDLLYSDVKNGGPLHVALVGIFDVNGDGKDDISSLIRDLTQMGISVDAYFDLQKRAWVGQLTERTRTVVVGYFPQNAIGDANRDDKTKLIGLMTKAVGDAQQKGAKSVDLADFFTRNGYRYRLNVSESKINQAAIPYLSGVGTGMELTPPAP